MILLADNDAKPGTAVNPGVTAATTAAREVGGLLAIPPQPGDLNDLAVALGSAAVLTCISLAAAVPVIKPTYAMPSLHPNEARAHLEGIVIGYMAEVAAYWANAATGPNQARDGESGRPMV